MEKSVLSFATKGLAGAVAIAGGSQAYGAIVTIPAPATLTATSATTAEQIGTVDVDGDGNADLVFGVGYMSTATSGLNNPYVYSGVAAYSGGVVGYVKTGANANYYYASKLAKGATIGSSSALVQGSYLTTLELRYAGSNIGNFVGKGYLGFSFQEADGTHYGWLSVTSTDTGQTPADISATLSFGPGAYDTVAGESILAGAGAAVPEPGSLAALAFGAAGVAGVAAYRRKQAAKAA